jgi:hypothetical protein
MVRDFPTIWRYFDELYADFNDSDSFYNRKPLLAHYSTTSVVEQILKNNEIWLGSPLLMNDVEEVRFGINLGTQVFLSHPPLRDILSNSASTAAFEAGLNAAYRNFDDNHAFDTYIICFCEHKENDIDGLLSMWRGYGDSGRGVAIVFDGRELAETPESPLIIAKVRYRTREERIHWFERTAERFGKITRERQLTDNEISMAAWALFARLRLYALFTKHLGFGEENEWRIAYLPERDPGESLTPYLDYHNGPRGVEPKLKLKFSANPAWGGQDISLERLVHRFILGPTASSPLAVKSFERMLNKLNRPDLANRVVGSGIPYRTY